MPAKVSNPLLQAATWQSFDIILGNTYITYGLLTSGFLPGPKAPSGFYERCVAIFHAPVVNHAYFSERLDAKAAQKCRIGGVSREAVQVVSAHFGGGDKQMRAPPFWCPFGADLTHFSILPNRANNNNHGGTLRRIGFVGNPKAPVKQYHVLEAICDAAQCEKVVINGRPLSDQLYADIDLLICCSEFESGPLGIFEAAACGVAVLCRKGVGNASQIKGVATFDSVIDAVALVEHWKADPSTFCSYAAAVCKEVRENWDMDTLIERHLLPVLDKMPAWLDFVEIGTCDFETEIQSCSATARGISVDPLAHYLDRLPNKPGVKKVNAAISDTDGQISCFYIASADIEGHNLPFWVKGCNSIGREHPTVANLLDARGLKGVVSFRQQQVPMWSFETFAKEFGLHQVDHLKIDTEGHDCIILASVVKTLRTNPRFLPPRKITFETNVLSAKAEQEQTIATLVNNWGYKVDSTFGDNTVLVLE